MLKLYNAGTSVCSVKVRVGLAEKHIEWQDVMLVLPKGEQFEPAYLALNPNGVVPTLVDGDTVVIESSVILEYIDELSDTNPLMPVDKAARATTRVWLLRCLEIHGAINTMTFTTAGRDAILKKNTPEQITASIARMPNPNMAAKRRALLDSGLNSPYVTSDFFVLRRTFDDMQAALEKTEWLSGDDYGLTDVALVAYIDRLERLGMAGMWKDRTPAVGTWLEAMKSRPSYARAMDDYISAAEAEAMAVSGSSHWAAVEERWQRFLN